MASRVKCINYMDFKAIRETARQHQEKYGNPEEPPFYDLSDLNLVRNCTICDFGGTGRLAIDKLARLFEDRAVAIQDKVKELTGEPLKRVCYKEAKECPTK